MNSPTHKKLHNARMLKRNGSWIYCTSCDKTVAYLCYTTYSFFRYDFTCNCGSSGFVEMGNFDPDKSVAATLPLLVKRNRLCCASDEDPLFSVVDKHVKNHSYQVVCKQCGTYYIKE